MKSSLPIISLLLCLCAAGAILWGGSKLGIRQEIRRIVPDRTPLKAAANALQKECRRLDRLYESHLQRIIEQEQIADDASIQKACRRVSGVRQVSVIHDGERSTWDRHRWIERDLETESPVLRRPYVVGDRAASVERGIPISRDPVFDDPFARSGWLDAPGTPLYYWARVEKDRAVLFEIIPEEVAEAMGQWFDENVRVPEAIRRPGEIWEQDPDFILPVSSRFSSWELGAYDLTEKHTTTSALVLGSSGLLAALLAGSGLAAFVLQRRAFRRAEEKVSFVNQVSHELRTPLMNIQLNADLAAERTGSSQPEVARRLALVRGESKRLGRLIENVLTFSRSERGSLRLHERLAIPDEIVHEVLDQFSPALQRRGIRVETDGSVPGQWCLDADALAQILANLISNVEKYAANGKLLRIGLHETDGWLLVEVQDAGEGIDHRDRERIFKAFKRLGHQATEGATGAGLGLSIARDLATRMGGTLKARPSEQGARLALRIPIRKAA